MYAVVQIGSRIFRSPMGMNRSVPPRFGVWARAGDASVAAAAAVEARNWRRVRSLMGRLLGSAHEISWSEATRRRIKARRHRSAARWLQALRAATRLGQMLDGGRLELGIEAAHRLRHAGPAMLRGPAGGLGAEPVARPAIAEQAGQALRQCRGIALGHEMAGHAVLDRGGEPAHAGCHHGAAAGHGLERHHAEGLVIGGHDRRLRRGVEEPEPALGLGAEEADAPRESERGHALTEIHPVAVLRLVLIATDDEELGGAVESSHGLEQGLEALDGLKAPDIEEQRLRPEPPHTPRPPT